ncbi:MAG: NAD(P)/FAD-dependent oxidoreductase [Peptococcaceae bacterium]|jgi:NADPH-dependent 2,4-dienoyl-CoA reductase/sulfur reductase-like enzyme|nr:NAD(P)/FAD-dependent oxidoreductase [Peptococcaceae bacterium]
MYDLIVVGGGPAGMAAALSAKQAGLRDILILERDRELGGILNQCIHTGFGLHYFHEELTGPEYAGRFIDMLKDTGIQANLDTMVLEITPSREIHAVSRKEGYRILQAKSIVLAMGCRERTRGAIGIPGSRPAGILTAGAAQRYINIEGYMVGHRVLILGSGDIGLIMARRLTLEGATVLACVELMPYSGGLNRNLVQCLDDFGIPLYLSHTVTDIRGSRRVESAIVSKVDENLAPIPGTEMVFDCDTILLSVGLIPENELSRQAGVEISPRTGGAVVYEDRETSLPGVFACGNVLHVHDLVDFVTLEGELAGRSAALFVSEGGDEPVIGGSQHLGDALDLTCGEGVGYVVPQKIRPEHMPDLTDLYFRVRRPYTKSAITLQLGKKEIARYTRSRLFPGEMEKVALPKKLLVKELLAEHTETQLHGHQPDAAATLTISVEEDIA